MPVPSVSKKPLLRVVPEELEDDIFSRFFNRSCSLPELAQYTGCTVRAIAHWLDQPHVQQEILKVSKLAKFRTFIQLEEGTQLIMQNHEFIMGLLGSDKFHNATAGTQARMVESSRKAGNDLTKLRHDLDPNRPHRESKSLPCHDYSRGIAVPSESSKTLNSSDTTNSPVPLHRGPETPTQLENLQPARAVLPSRNESDTREDSERSAPLPKFHIPQPPDANFTIPTPETQPECVTTLTPASQDSAAIAEAVTPTTSIPTTTVETPTESPEETTLSEPTSGELTNPALTTAPTSAPNTQTAETTPMASAPSASQSEFELCHLNFELSATGDPNHPS